MQFKCQNTAFEDRVCLKGMISERTKSERLTHLSNHYQVIGLKYLWKKLFYPFRGASFDLASGQGERRGGF